MSSRFFAGAIDPEGHMLVGSCHAYEALAITDDGVLKTRSEDVGSSGA